LVAILSQAESALTIRPLTGPDELNLFLNLTYSLDNELREDLAAGRRRPEWLWVALRHGRVVARAGWWGESGEDAPAVLDVLDIAGDPDRIEVGAALLTAALLEVVPVGASPPEYIRFVPSDWREVPRFRQVVEDRMAIAARTGARLLVERLRLEWRPGTPVAVPTGRLEFHPVEDDAQLVELMTLAMGGTLDAHSRDDLTHLSAREGAVSHFQDELARYESPREWWRIAARPDSEAIGFVIPARNDYHAIIAYLGVVPAHRGLGYVNELLAEGTRVLAAQNVPRIRASTDLDNIPMAQAFARAGWINFERAISMTWS